ncbi:MAG: methyltransferase domain-containing protein [Sulfurimonadaceae bacterium]
MSQQDRQKWDEKYIKKSELLRPREASENIKKFVEKSTGAKALDLACGAGRNTIYLAKHGYEVDALDIAEAALDALAAEAHREEVTSLVNARLADLDTFTPATETYELIIMMNYLDRGLIVRAQEGLKREGLFIVETYMDDEGNEKKDSNVENLLKKEELKTLFGEGYDVLFYDEFENEAYELYSMKKQVIVVRKR